MHSFFDIMILKKEGRLTFILSRSIICCTEKEREGKIYEIKQYRRTLKSR